KNIREIPIIDVVCHNPEIQGSDVPVLLSSFVFVDHQPRIQLPFHKQKGQNQIGYEKQTDKNVLKTTRPASGREAIASPSANLKSKRFTIRATQHLQCHCNGEEAA
uniref:Uncharacterized protein n=1 Tax=Triticum urartu TaxID=4572 RepID=A0A8R7P850_TRIUA